MRMMFPHSLSRPLMFSHPVPGPHHGGIFSSILIPTDPRGESEIQGDRILTKNLYFFIKTMILYFVIFSLKKHIFCIFLKDILNQ